MKNMGRLHMVRIDLDEDLGIRPVFICRTPSVVEGINFIQDVRRNINKVLDGHMIDLVRRAEVGKTFYIPEVEG